ncbi:hypothetical protein QFC24_002489 [Naganishia onofrii]|uniref:Uncharacterized protein n=1 Tax=Naganishia onofrii TaxID=1851511 RepID=A0ACC2XQ01_9TREE|nr:hypothetical protein QFC24_002489 [Naganishia onofrii]
MSAHTIAIIGAGSVGSTIAHTLLLRRVVGDLILVDIDDKLCRAQVDDLSDGTFLANVRIRQGTLADARRAEITIITAGAKQRPGDTRLDLIDRNFKVLKSVLDGMKPFREDAVLLLVANPVDVLTAMAQRISGLPKNQVLGSGTLLDSVRLTRVLAHKLKIADRSVQATVIGEHGDSQCVAWSATTVAGQHLSNVLLLSPEERFEIAELTRNKAGAIIAAKGFTSFGVAAATTTLCESIIFDQRQVLPERGSRDGAVSTGGRGEDSVGKFGKKY